MTPCITDIMDAEILETQGARIQTATIQTLQFQNISVSPTSGLIPFIWVLTHKGDEIEATLADICKWVTSFQVELLYIQIDNDKKS